MAAPTFATAINCLDGRVQAPVWQWMTQHLGVDYVDTVTEAGPAKVLTRGPLDGLEALTRIESLRKGARLSVEVHHSNTIAVVGHHDCAGDPVSKEETLDQLRKAVEVVVSWRLPVRVLGLWVDEQWVVEPICDTSGELAKGLQGLPGR